MTARTTFLTALLCAALVAGCASVPPTGVPFSQAPQTLAAKWQQHQAALRSVARFALDARVAASGSFGVTGNLRWIEHDGAFNVHFAGPFGAGAVDITGDAFVVTIRSGTQRYVTSEPERFLLQRFGWTLPLRGLRYWALGLPAPADTDAAPATLTLNAHGELRTLTQNGWDIEYTDYQRVASHMLPHKMTMHGEKTTFRIIIDDWHLPAVTP